MSFNDGTDAGGQDADTWALARLLAGSGVIDARRGAPISEALILGLGGGLGFMYFVFLDQADERVYLFVGPRNLTKSGTFQRSVWDRLGLMAAVKETASAGAAGKHLRATLEAGRPALVWGCRASLVGSGLPPEWRGMAEGTWLVEEWDAASGAALVADRGGELRWVSEADLGSARGAIRSVKHRLVTVDPPAGAIDPSAALREGLTECVAGLIAPERGTFSGNFGLAALSKWADLLTDPKDKRGWPKLFPTGPRLFAGLRDVYFEVEVLSGPGLLRGLFAECLEEGAALLGLPGLLEVGRHYQELAAQWSAFAEAALPAVVPAFGEVKRLLRDRDRAYREGGTAAPDRLVQLNADLARVEANLKGDFPLSYEEMRSLRADLRDRLVWIAAAERRAVEDLAACLGITSPSLATA